MPLVLAVLAALGAYGRARVDQQHREMARGEQVALSMGRAVVQHGIDMVVRDLDFVAGSSTLRDAILQPSDQTLERLANDFRALAYSKQRYDRLRLIAPDGRELVQVDERQGARQVAPSVPASPDRIAEILALPRGALLVEPMTLARGGDADHGARVPTMRFGMPVDDASGVRHGALLLNYRAAELLRLFRSATRSVGDRAMLLDANGYGLWAPEGAEGKRLAGGQGEPALADRAPEAWRAMQAAPTGQIELDDGLWSWDTVALADADAALPVEGATERGVMTVVASDGMHWRAVSHLPAQTWDGIPRSVWPPLVVAGLTLLSLAGLGCWKLGAAWSELESAERELRDANRRLQQRVDERTAELERKVSALVESDTRYRSTFESAAVGMARVAPDGRFIEINDAFCALLGRGRGEIVAGGINFRDLTHPEDLAADERQIARLLAGEANHYALEKRYVAKDGHPIWARLSVSLVRDAHGAPLYFVSSAVDLGERKRLEAELLKMAHVDFLTGLANRRRFLERLEEEHARLRRDHGVSAGVLMIDLDYFKSVNDLHGHAVGDALLKHFAATVTPDLRSIDLVGRLGGEEFAIMLPGASLDEAVIYAERLRERVAASPMPLAEGRLPMSVSIGCSILTAADHDVDAALARADKALYRAKRSGRNRTERAVTATA